MVGSKPVMNDDGERRIVAKTQVVKQFGCHRSCGIGTHSIKINIRGDKSFISGDPTIKRPKQPPQKNPMNIPRKGRAGQVAATDKGHLRVKKEPSL